MGISGCKKEEAKVVVPNLVGQDLDQAEKALGAVPLKPGNIGGIPGAPPPGTYVVSQTPSVGQQVAPNSPVDLMVAVPVPVPTVTGDVTEAVASLQNVGLKVAFQRRSALFVTKAKVEAQDPAPNTPVHQGTVVTLTVTTPRVDIGSILGLVAKEPAYQKLNSEYKNILDAFIGDPTSTRDVGMAPSNPGNAGTQGGSSTPPNPTKSR